MAGVAEQVAGSGDSSRLRTTAMLPRVISVITSRTGFLFGKGAQGWGSWVAHWVEHLTLDFGSGHDLTASGFKPRVGLCADRDSLLENSLSLSLSACPSLMVSFYPTLSK